MPSNHLEKLARNFLGRNVSGRLMNSCVSVAKVSLPSLPSVANDRIIIPCKKWYIEIVNGEIKWIKPHPKFGFTHIINTNYSDRSGKLFQNYLNTSIPDKDVQKLLQEYAGYTLLNDNRYEAAMMLTGKGANGKSVLIETLRALHVAARSMRLDQMKGFELAGIVGASLLTSDETPKKKVCVDTLKALISGNVISIRAAYGQPFDYRNRAKILVSANDIPSFDDNSNGFWRRFIFVPFEHVVPKSKRDPLLARKIIDNELGVVLKWAVDGLLRLMANNGQFTKPACTEQAKQDIKLDGNSVLKWLDDHVAVKTDDHTMLKQDVYNEYYDWATENGLIPVGAVRFWTQLKNDLPFKWSDKQKRSYDRKVKRFVNFRINQPELAEDATKLTIVSPIHPSNDEVLVDEARLANDCPF